MIKQETQEREFRPLNLINDNFEKIVISMDDFDFHMMELNI